MKRIVYLFVAVLFCSMAKAQPESWAKKAAKSLFTVKTFDASGSLLGSGNGFFVGETGEAVGNFAPFNGSARAIVIDAAGKEYPVDCIVGANEMYDIAKFRVNVKKCIPLSVGSPAAVESALWLLPYAQKQVKPIEGKVVKVEKVNNDYDYYSLTLPAPENAVGCPLLNAAGEVVGLLQLSSSDDKNTQYAVGASFATSLKMTAFGMNDAAMKATSIKKELPDELDQAITTLYLSSTLGNADTFVEIVDDFIAKFPQAPDGYSYKGQIMAAKDNYTEADKFMLKAIELADNKAEAQYNYARLMYQNLVYFPEKASQAWTYEKALDQIDQAVSADPQQLYMTQKAEILFISKRYDESYNTYREVLDKFSKTPEAFYGAARCKEMLNDSTAFIALLDSAVATFSQPYLKEAAPYLFARAQALAGAGKYRQAVNDYNEYEKLMPAQVTGQFYYIRAQAEINGRLFQQAINDLDRAIAKNPEVFLFHSEKASLLVRVNLLDEAIEAANECIRISPDASDGYLFLGLAQCLKNDKLQGVRNLLKAKDLGDPQADVLIEKYGKQ